MEEENLEYLKLPENDLVEIADASGYALHLCGT